MLKNEEILKAKNSLVSVFHPFLQYEVLLVLVVFSSALSVYKYSNSENAYLIVHLCNLYIQVSHP